MKKILFIVVAVALVSLIIVRLMANREKINAKKEVKTDLDYVNVSVTKVQAIDMDQRLSLVGNLTAFAEIQVSSEMQGTVTSVRTELGQHVSKNTVLATIDNRTKKLNFNASQISLDKKLKDFERYKNLYSGGTATEQELEEARVAYQNAVIERQKAEKELSDATIVSPSEGIITEKHIEKGSYVSVGSPIVSMVDISKLKVRLNVSENTIYQLNIGDKATITTSVYPGVPFEGTICFISPKGNDSHNYQVEIVIPNSDKHPLKAGTFVSVNISLAIKGKRLCIPRESLQGSISDAKVYVAKNNKAVIKAIKIGIGNNDYLEVLSGLKENEAVITSGFVNLENGKSIRVISNN